MGITYNSDRNEFNFDFTQDCITDIISLKGQIQRVEAFGKCFYYGYEFAENVDGGVRSAFIKYLKFTQNLREQPNLTRFIQQAINALDKQINLYDYDLVVMPQSSSRVNQYMLRYIYRFAQPMLQYMELVKTLPERVSFDMQAYEKQYLDDVLENGRPRYTEAQKDDVIRTINEMMDRIHRKDYFTIAKDVKKSRFRPYMENFLHFENESDEKLCRTIHEQNILVVDDIATSGSTLNEILRTLRVINEDNKITIFSLIGRKDLMVESM